MRLKAVAFQAVGRRKPHMVATVTMTPLAYQLAFTEKLLKVNVAGTPFVETSSAP